MTKFEEYARVLPRFAKEVPSHPQMAQKVKVVVEDRCDLKKWGCWCCWVSSRSGWLLELLTELKIAIYCPQGSGTLRQEYARVCQSMQEYARVCQSMPVYARVCQSMP